ncbi:hypothetical protein BGX31_001301 [Mortierella sp. GBA43]|nr:hypothetical protein BGX31_001301 [Mortierella sp. GBA43]
MASTWEDGNMHCPGEADSILDEELGQLSPIPFSELPSLTNIGMCSQGIVKLSSNIRFLASATCVQICCNELSMIPAEIGYLRNLTLLDLSKNNLTTLPDTIMNLTKLVDLKLSFNQLKSIPAGIGGLTKLVALALDNNQLESIPRQIGSIKGLVSLDLSNNPIKVLPAEVGKLQFLRRLILERCPLVDEFRHSPLYSPPTLLELAARVMVRHDVPVPARLPPHLKDYLKTARTCTYCEGPFFESSVTRGKMVEKNEVYIPLEYTLCVPHWNTELERVKLMFCKRPITAPPIKPSSGSQTTVGHISISRKPPSRSESASRITGPSSPGSGTLNGQQAIGVSSSSSSSSPNNNSNGNGGNGRRMTADNNDRPLSAVIGNRLSMLLYLKGDNNGNSNNNSNNSGSNNNKRERPTSRFRASSQPVVSSMRSSNLAPGGGSSSSNTTPTTPTTTTAPTVVRNTNGTEENSASRPSARRATTNGILSRAVFRLKRPLSMASAMETTSVPIGHTEEASSTSVTDSE